MYEIDPHTHDDVGVVAFGRNALVARAAFAAALERMPRSMLMIRHRARVIETGVGEALRRLIDRPGGTASGTMRANGVSWRFRRERAGPEIS